jgi:hypothetical protein
MIVDIMDVEKFVSINRLKPITSPLFFKESGEPDPDGLFSYDIFGPPGSKERRERPAYI